MKRNKKLLMYFLVSKESKFKLNAPKINDINKKRCLY